MKGPEQGVQDVSMINMIDHEDEVTVEAFEDERIWF